MNVLLICSMGASTANMCKKIEGAAAQEGIELTATAVAMAMMNDKIGEKPVEAIDMMAYGMMDGSKVLRQIKGMM